MELPCPFVQHKDIFGKSNEGVHKYRLLDTPIVDYVMTIVLAALITKITGIPWVVTTIVAFILSITLHILFGVETTVTNYFDITCT